MVDDGRGDTLCKEEQFWAVDREALLAQLLRQGYVKEQSEGGDANWEGRKGPMIVRTKEKLSRCMMLRRERGKGHMNETSEGHPKEENLKRTHTHTQHTVLPSHTTDKKPAKA